MEGEGQIGFLYIFLSAYDGCQEVIIVDLDIHTWTIVAIVYAREDLINFRLWYSDQSKSRFYFLEKQSAPIALVKQSKSFLQFD